MTKLGKTGLGQVNKVQEQGVTALAWRGFQ
jgi:hypothetical protein